MNVIDTKTRFAFEKLQVWLKAKAINPNYRVGRGAHAPRVRFCAPSRKTPPAQVSSQLDLHTTSTRCRTRGASSDTRGRVCSPIQFFGINRSVRQPARRFPEIEVFATGSQLRLACISSPSNLTEGPTPDCNRNFVLFHKHAYGQLVEVDSVLFWRLNESYMTERLAKRIASLNCAQLAQPSETSFARRNRPQALNSRPSTLD